MRKIILSILFLTSMVSAQKDMFLKEFREANQWFSLQEKLKLVQNFYYYNDSTISKPLDSLKCFIIKNRSKIHFSYNDMESYSDSSYSIKVIHPGRIIIVNKNVNPDSNVITSIFNDAFSGFSSFRKSIDKEIICWDLDGGLQGIRSAKIMIEENDLRIYSILIRFFNDHPLMSIFINPNDENKKEVWVKIEYDYLTKDEYKDSFELSDFISINENQIVPSEKFKDYKIQHLK